jgi:electron transfer flavoprotein-quinone oxidoreductase
MVEHSTSRDADVDVHAAADVDVVVVGAGPAGACAAIVLARAGHSVVLLERGPFPGSKNMYGGVVYPRILDELIPHWWDEIPIQRWVTRRSTMVLTDDQALTVDFRSQHWAAPPYNGATAYRPDFDHWLAGHAESAGAQLLCSTTVVGLLRDGAGRVVGVRTDRPDGDLRARLVIACDGVNSFLAKEAGLYPPVEAKNFTLGVKETLALPKDVIDERFGVRGREGVDIEILGGTGGVNGGGFVYTNLDTVAVGAVLKLPKLAAQQRRPEQIIASLKAHPAIAPLIEGAEMKEYSAHLIPEAGLSMMPKLAGDGMLVAGDAAAMCLAAGIWLEGVNFAMASGMYAGRAGVEALRSGDVSAAGLAGYERRLNETFVLRDHRKLRRAPELVLSDRVQHVYPELITSVVERMFRVDNPTPKPGLRRIVAQERKRLGIRRRDLARDGLDGLRSFG